MVQHLSGTQARNVCALVRSKIQKWPTNTDTGLFGLFNVGYENSFLVKLMRTRYSNRLGLNICYSANISLTIFIHFSDDVKIDSYHCFA